MSYKILVIEDDAGDFDAICKVLSPGYECYPTKSQYPAFKDSFIEFLRNEHEDRSRLGLKQIEQQLEIGFDLIILDMSLLPGRADLLGMEILKIIRSNDVFTPIILLTKHHFNIVSKAFEAPDSIANYYLCKEGALTIGYLKHRLCPVVSMLLYWQRLYKCNKDILDAINESDVKLVEIVEDRFGVLKHTLDDLCQNTDELVLYSKINLRMVQNHLKKSDTKGYEFISQIIHQYRLCAGINEVKYCSIREFLEKSQDKIIERLKDGELDEVIEILKGLAKEHLGMNEEENLSVFAAKMVLKATAGAWRFYRTGDV